MHRWRIITGPPHAMKIDKDSSIHGPRWSPLWQISRQMINGVERGYILTPIAAP